MQTNRLIDAYGEKQDRLALNAIARDAGIGARRERAFEKARASSSRGSTVAPCVRILHAGPRPGDIRIVPTARG